MRKNKDFSDARRLSILKEYLTSSCSKRGIERKYGLSYGCIRYWLRTFDVADKPLVPYHMSDQEQTGESPSGADISSLELRIKELESALKEARMGRDAYECMIELAEEKYHIKVRKNSDAK